MRVPLDVFGYYPPGQSVYHEVEQDGELSREGNDTKVASTVLKVGARLDIPGLVHAAIEYTKEQPQPVTMEQPQPVTLEQPQPVTLEQPQAEDSRQAEKMVCQ